MRFLPLCAIVEGEVSGAASAEHRKCDLFRAEKEHKRGEKYMNKRNGMRIGVVLVCLLTLFLCLGGIAAAEEAVESGSCGSNATYTITGNKTDGFTLTISGTGSLSSTPWRNGMTGVNTYRTTIKTIVIGEGITGIRNESFMGLQGVETVSIPTTLKTIPYKAFMDCLLLSSIDLNKVTAVNTQAFQGCTSLSSVTANSLKSIAASSFKNCNLTSFTFSASFTTYEGSAFWGNKRLTEFVCADGQQKFKVQNGILYSKDGKTLVAVPPAYSGTLNISSAVTKVGDYAAFFNTGITQVTVPASVTELGYGAFYGMQALKEVTLNCACDIAEDCFCECAKLTDVSLGNGITGIGVVAFDGTGLSALPELPESVLYIDSDAFPFDLDGMLPERFVERENTWVVLNTVPMLVQEDYDSANSLLSLINQDSILRGSMTPLTTSKALSELAMKRAAEIALYFDDLNEVRPDGTKLQTEFGPIRECVVKDVNNADGALSRLKNTQFLKDKITNSAYSGAGIGCVSTGRNTYWVVILQSDAGTLSSYGTGTAAVTREVEYAEYMVSDVSVTVVKPFVYTGEKIEPSILFEGTNRNDTDVSCSIAPDRVEYSIADTSIVALDEYGMPWGVGAGTTQGTVRFAGQTYPFEVYVSNVSTNVSSNAVLTYDCTIGDAFGIGFLIPQNVYSAYADGILIVSVPEYSGDTETGKRYSVVRDYVTMAGPNDTPCRKYNYYGIAAKEMSSRVEATFVGINGSTVKYYSPSFYSVTDYAVNMFSHAGNDSRLKTLLADMLYYGAEAQQYFGYHTAEPATINMTAEMKNCATTQTATVADNSYSDEETGGSKVLISGTSLSLENRPQLNIYLMTTEPVRYMKVVITENGGQNASFEIPATEWKNCGNGRYRVEVSGISVLDYRAKYTIICKKDGIAVSNRVTTGVEGYALLANRQGRTVWSLTDRLLRFGDAAQSYLATR